MRDDADVKTLGQKYGIWTFIVITFVIVSVLIEMVCVYLGFGFNAALYFKCCSPCHNRVHPIADRQVRRMSTTMAQIAAQSVSQCSVTVNAMPPIHEEKKMKLKNAASESQHSNLEL